MQSATLRIWSVGSESLAPPSNFAVVSHSRPAAYSPLSARSLPQLPKPPTPQLVVCSRHGPCSAKAADTDLFEFLNVCQEFPLKVQAGVWTS